MPTLNKAGCHTRLSNMNFLTLPNVNTSHIIKLEDWKMKTDAEYESKQQTGIQVSEFVLKQRELRGAPSLRQKLDGRFCI